METEMEVACGLDTVTACMYRTRSTCSGSEQRKGKLDKLDKLDVLDVLDQLDKLDYEARLDQLTGGDC
jgi:hypothetical protein